MAKNRRFRNVMISDARKAAKAMNDSALHAKLKALGFTSATMSKAAEELQELQSELVSAQAAAGVASAALETKAREFVQIWASYCNGVRALTPDLALRAQHGVKSPGVLKGPAFRRGPRKSKDAPSTAPEPSINAPAPKASVSLSN